MYEIVLGKHKKIYNCIFIKCNNQKKGSEKSEPNIFYGL
jgi:hypothetical protein